MGWTGSTHKNTFHHKPNFKVTDFQQGVQAMARNCLPAVELVRKGVWTLGDMEKWLQWVIASDSGIVLETSLIPSQDPRNKTI